MNEKSRGICRLSVVPMRGMSRPDAPIVSELLFGEHYSILVEKNDMLHIQLHFDNSIGWIRKDQHTAITEEYFNQVNLSDYKVCVDLSGTIYFQKKHVHILLGSVLPITTNELFKLEEQVAFNGEAKSLSQKREFEYMKEIIKKYLYAPFLAGGKTPFGIDAGGFIQQVFKICGYKIPRAIEDQYKIGQDVADPDALTPGDLVFTESQPGSGFIFMGGDDYAGISNGQVNKLSIDELGEGKWSIRRVLLKKLVHEQG